MSSFIICTSIPFEVVSETTLHQSFLGSNERRVDPSRFHSRDPFLVVAIRFLSLGRHCIRLSGLLSSRLLLGGVCERLFVLAILQKGCIFGYSISGEPGHCRALDC